MQQKEENNYEEWLERINKAAGIAEQAVVDEVVHDEKVVAQTLKSPSFWKNIFISLGIFAVAILPRLYFIFYVTGTQNAGVGWYNDSYHHWQIAYLTQQIGFHKEFLRLWDLQGLEYFWGFLHPFILSTLFTITGTADILVSRLFNTIVGSMTTVVLFWMVKKYFNVWVALGTTLLAIVNPIGIVTDTTGMQEPLGIFVFLLGIYFWPSKSWLTAIFWFLASMTRGEYWVFIVGLLTVTLVFDKNRSKKLALIVPYGVLIFMYIKYLLDKTGNAIYPIYWNFLGNAAGKWEKDIPLTTAQEEIRWIFIALLILSSIAGLIVLRKRPRLYLFSLLGIGNLMFLSIFVGLTQYLKSYLPRFWVDRIFWLSYMWLGFALAVALLYFLPKYLKRGGLLVGIATILILAVGIQQLWVPIQFYLSDNKTLPLENKIAKQVMTHYRAGSVLIPGNDPIFTYALYKNGLQGKDIRGEMFDPYFYITGDAYADWKDHRDTVINFFKNENIHLILFTPDEKRYVQLVSYEKKTFTKIEIVGPFEVYEVNF